MGFYASAHSIDVASFRVFRLSMHEYIRAYIHACINTPQSYRPISNLSVLSKLTECVVSTQLQTYVDMHDLLPHHQSVYRRGHSMETALVKVYSDLVQGLDSGNVAVLALLDMTVAFDSVDHIILLERLRCTFGISDLALAWFSTYLCGRSQSVCLRDEQSDFQAVPHGVPQGSVLGPLLFILYTAELSDIAAKHHINVHFYADDTSA